MNKERELLEEQTSTEVMVGEIVEVAAKTALSVIPEVEHLSLLCGIAFKTIRLKKRFLFRAD